jgi:RNA-directed DNA polymerase
MQKKYSLSASPLYKLWTRKRLATALKMSLREFSIAMERPQYRCFINDKGRSCQQPIGMTDKAHQRIAILLARIKTPSFLMSVKGPSYVDNAKMHIGDYPSVRIDISKYYPSVKQRRIWEFFRYHAERSDDVARDLSALCTINGGLPTGSPISGYLAFLANQEMFLRLNSLCEQSRCVMTVYVDDIMITGVGANAELLAKAIRAIRATNLAHNRKKSAVLPASMPKRITGVIVMKSEIRVPNGRQHKIGKLFAEFQAGEHTYKPNLLGRLSEAAQVQKVFFDKRVTVAHNSARLMASTLAKK